MKMLKHEKGVFVPKHEDVTADDLHRSLSAFFKTYEKFVEGMGLHPEADQIEAMAPHLMKVWQIVVEMQHYPVETKDVDDMTVAEWANA